MRAKLLSAAVAGGALVLGVLAAPVQADLPDDPQGEVVQILGINDFHGRISANYFNGEGGAAVLAGAVEELEAEFPNTVFAAAGDLIGASTFESFIAQDKPTIDALNAAGLDVSAVGNHEFDQGYADLVDRVMEPYDEETNPYGGAEWQYIGANVKMKDTGDPAIPEVYTQTFNEGAENEVTVGFVGAVTEHLDSLVSPAGIEDIEVTDIVEAANEYGDQLRTEDGADIVVLLVHEGAPTTDPADAVDPANDFGKIVTGVDDGIDAIISGHTHLAYNHAIPVQGWIDEDRDVTERPVVSAGQYGMNINQLLFDVDPDTGAILEVSQEVLNLVDGDQPAYSPIPAVEAIVAAAVAESDVLGAVEIGEVTAPFNRAKLTDGSTENRGGESTLGNFVAEVQRAQTPETIGGAEIAFMNPGGLRADMVGSNADGYPAPLTYKQAAVVQPFANTLVRMTMTGDQLKTLLEQQWQPAGAPRPFLKLGISEGFTYTYDPNGDQGDRVQQMWLNGEEIDPAADYAVTANSFLAAGGDDFDAFEEATDHQDTGVTDLQAMVDYNDEFDGAVSPDYSQRAVGVTFPGTGPDHEHWPGETLEVDLSSLSFSTADDAVDSSVDLSIGGESIGSADVDSAVGAEVFDETGRAAVSVPLPGDLAAGTYDVEVSGATTGTATSFRVQVTDAGTSAPSETTLSVDPTSLVVGTDGATATVTVTSDDSDVPAKGTVEVLSGEEVLGSAALRDGEAEVSLSPFDTVGTHAVVARYLGDARTDGSDSEPVDVEVSAATSTTSVAVSPANPKAGGPALTATATVSSSGDLPPTGQVTFTRDGQAVGTANLTAAGTATISLGRPRTAGATTVVATYTGDPSTTESTATTRLRVTKADATIKVAKKPKKPRRTVRPGLKVKVKVPGVQQSGQIIVKRGKKVLGKGKVNAKGRVNLRLTRIKKPGRHKIRVIYRKDANVKRTVRVINLRVR